jgi:hypothetical protein
MATLGASTAIPPTRSATETLFVVAFDSNIADDSVQFRWVQRQLEGLDRQRYHHVVAFFHHPAFSSGPHGGPTIERQTATIRARYMPLFRKHNVDLLLTGHEHLFEHWVERYRGADGSRRRIDQIVSGGGGAPLYAYTGEPSSSSTHGGRPDSVRLEHLVRPAYSGRQSVSLSHRARRRRQDVVRRRRRRLGHWLPAVQERARRALG